LALDAFKGVSRRLLAEPLIAGGRGIGAVVVSRDHASPPFTVDDASALADVASQASVAMDNARLYAEAQHSAGEGQALFEVAGLVGSTLDIERIIELIVDRCRVLLAVAAVGIWKLDRETGRLRYHHGAGFSSRSMEAFELRVGEGTTGRAVLDRAPVWSRDVLGDPAITISPETRAGVEREGYRAVLSVPL